jgi:NADH:ubiquinone oxidoreductase subunit 3 (subunit A)
MGTELLTSPVAFVVYLVLVAILSYVGKVLAGPSQMSSLKSSTYSSGEAAPARAAAPSYRPFFAVALFFAILHLGVLMLGTGGLTWMTGIYGLGLLLALLALILG